MSVENIQITSPFDMYMPPREGFCLSLLFPAGLQYPAQSGILSNDYFARRSRMDRFKFLYQKYREL